MELHLLRSLSGYQIDRLKYYGRFLLLSVVLSLVLLAILVACAILVYNASTAGYSPLILPIILLYLSAGHYMVKQFIRLSGCDEEELTDRMPRSTGQAAEGCHSTLGGVSSTADR